MRIVRYQEVRAPHPSYPLSRVHFDIHSALVHCVLLCINIRGNNVALNIVIYIVPIVQSFRCCESVWLEEHFLFNSNESGCSYTTILNNHCSVLY